MESSKSGAITTWANWWARWRNDAMRGLSLLVLLLVVAVIVGALIKGARKPKPPSAPPSAPVLNDRVVSVTTGVTHTTTENGKPKYTLQAAKDTAFADGRHEVEQVVLTAFAADGKEESKAIAERGTHIPQQNLVELAGNVKLTRADGLEITSAVMRYDQLNRVATTDQAVQFKRADVSGSANGAIVYVSTKVIDLLKDAHLVKLPVGNEIGKEKNSGQSGVPVEINAARAIYDDVAGVARFVGNARILHGNQTAQAENITAMINAQSKRLERAELRGAVYLKEQTPNKLSELRAREMDVFFDGAQQLKRALANGEAHAQSLEKDAPRELHAERIEATYQPTPQGSVLQQLNTQGRTTLKIVEAGTTTVTASATPAPTATTTATTANSVVSAASNAGNATAINAASERVLVADQVQTTMQADGKFMAHAEATGNAQLTLMPLRVTPTAEKRTLRARKFTLDFFPTGNAIKTFVADGDAQAEFELLQPNAAPAAVSANANNKAKAQANTKRSLKSQTMTAQVDERSQEVTQLLAVGEMKYTDGERNATAQRGTYDGAARTIALRGNPLLWDETARTNADEIDSKLDEGESLARGKVRTTYYSREATGGAAPFKQSKAPVTIASERATVLHREAAARYEGNVRAWQGDDFVRADKMELDKGERAMRAWGNVQSAFYSVERETGSGNAAASSDVPASGAASGSTLTGASPIATTTARNGNNMVPGKKEVVPIFVSAEQLDYRDEQRLVHYQGKVKIRQATDQLDAASAEALLDEQNQLKQLTARQNVVLTQPQRRGTGDLLVYTASTDAAVLTGKPAQITDNERAATTKGTRLTLYLRDARIEAADESSAKPRVRTTHRIQR